jgi:hypothetical protein
MDPNMRAGAIGAIASRLKYPQLLAIVGALLVIDLVVPDMIPFADEILLAALTALFALWREAVPASPADKPAEKNVTPRRQIPD